LAKSILVVDDEETVRSVIVEYLETLGLSCLQACDGEEAIEIMNTHYDVGLVVVDVHMPKMNGLKLLAEIKTVRPAFPVILMTGLRLTEKEIDIMKIKADEYLSKPVSLDLLRKSIKRLLKI